MDEEEDEEVVTTTAVTADADVRGAEDETVGDGRSGIMSPTDDAVTCTSDLFDSVLLLLSSQSVSQSGCIMMLADGDVVVTLVHS